MLTSEWLYTALVAALVVERLFELRLSEKNARWALSHGGVESGRRHFVWMKSLHAGLFVGVLVEVWWFDAPFRALLGWTMLGLALLSQALRYWTIHTLGRRWNVRVIVLPGRGAVAGGPFRFLRHPNYLAVVVEGVAIPLVHSAFVSALVFSVLNAWLLRVRIRCEERALEQHCGYALEFHDRPRLWPTRPRRT